MEHYSFVAPVMKTLLTKSTDTSFKRTLIDTLEIDSTSVEFYDKFQQLNRDEKWIAFIETEVSC